MKIEVTFDSLDEVREFTEMILVGQAPVQPAPAVHNTAVPVQAAPVQTAPVQTAPVQTAPVQTAPVQTTPVQMAVPTSTVAYTMDDLARAGMSLMDCGKQAELQKLLKEGFGVDALPQLPKEQYGAFATALREWGHRYDGPQERKHALLSASGSRAVAPGCTPSARLEEQFPDTTSEAASEGTLAHELAGVEGKALCGYHKLHQEKIRGRCEQAEKGSPVEGRDGPLHGRVPGLHQDSCPCHEVHPVRPCGGKGKVRQVYP